MQVLQMVKQELDSLKMKEKDLVEELNTYKDKVNDYWIDTNAFSKSFIILIMNCETLLMDTMKPVGNYVQCRQVWAIASTLHASWVAVLNTWSSGKDILPVEKRSM